MCVCVCLSWRLKASDQDFFPPCSCSDRLVDSDYMEQTDRHTSYRYAHTRTHLQTESSARGFFMCVCAGFYETSWGTVSQNAQMLILNPNFLSPHLIPPSTCPTENQSHVHTEGEPESSGVNAWIKPPLGAPLLLPPFIFLLKIHGDQLKTQMCVMGLKSQ